MGAKSLEGLEVWRRGCQLAVLVNISLRDIRDFGLRDRMQLAAVSIPSNIAEGSKRTPKDFVRHLRISMGSAAELRIQTNIAAKVEVIDNTAMSSIVEQTKQLAKMLQALINKLES